jgi:hypothetical protein
VHQAIRKTLKDQTDLFSILNGGICVVARAAEIDEKNKVLWLDRPSIINGSQTQGELTRYLSIPADQRSPAPSVRYEIIVTTDDDLIAEISIARNFQNDVRAISIAGRRGQLDDLEEALQTTFPAAKLRKSETDLTDEFIDTEKLVQVLFAVSPDCLWENFDDRQSLKNKAFTYSQKTRCLKMFQRIVENKEAIPQKELYEFCLDVVGQAWALYQEWKSSQAFYGTRLRKIQREVDGTVIEVPDGIIFPILASLAAFARRTNGRWQIDIPADFDKKELVDAATSVYQEIADHNPQTMGKNKACYSSLFRVTSIYAKLLEY